VSFGLGYHIKEVKSPERKKQTGTWRCLFVGLVMLCFINWLALASFDSHHLSSEAEDAFYSCTAPPVDK
jgi:hypothetical protein